MRSFRVPYPADPDARRSLFARAAAVLSRHGEYDGTQDEGRFQGRSPLGRFAGTYRALGDALEITLTHKPMLVPIALVEREVRRFMDSV
jgi:hypothetical protein